MITEVALSGGDDAPAAITETVATARDGEEALAAAAEVKNLVREVPEETATASQAPSAPEVGASGGGEKGGGCSFSPVTPVVMAGDKTKPIGDVKPGDKVEAADPKTGNTPGPVRSRRPGSTTTAISST